MATDERAPSELAERIDRETTEAKEVVKQVRALLGPLRPWQRRLVLDILRPEVK